MHGPRRDFIQANKIARGYNSSFRFERLVTGLDTLEARAKSRPKNSKTVIREGPYSVGILSTREIAVGFRHYIEVVQDPKTIREVINHVLDDNMIDRRPLPQVAVSHVDLEPVTNSTERKIRIVLEDKDEVMAAQRMAATQRLEKLFGIAFTAQDYQFDIAAGFALSPASSPNDFAYLCPEYVGLQQFDSFPSYATLCKAYELALATSGNATIDA